MSPDGGWWRAAGAAGRAGDVLRSLEPQ